MACVSDQCLSQFHQTLLKEHSLSVSCGFRDILAVFCYQYCQKFYILCQNVQRNFVLLIYSCYYLLLLIRTLALILHFVSLLYQSLCRAPYPYPMTDFIFLLGFDCCVYHIQVSFSRKLNFSLNWPKHLGQSFPTQGRQKRTGSRLEYCMCEGALGGGCSRGAKLLTAYIAWISILLEPPLSFCSLGDSLTQSKNTQIMNLNSYPSLPSLLIECPWTINPSEPFVYPKDDSVNCFPQDYMRIK